MTNLYFFSVATIFILAAAVFVLLFYISAPYGKFLRKGWGPAIKSKWAWMIMEFPSPALMVLFFITSDVKTITVILFLAFWLLHYIHRTFIYSFRQSGRDKAYPVIVALMAFLFNCLNGFVNGFGVFHHYTYSDSWLTSWQFIAGTLVFAAGFIINKISDEKLRKLRHSNPEEYVLPQGWMFRLISNPHYFGEMLEWAGWAIATWSLPGLAFFVFTFANLFPRAIASHRWYKNNFADFPAGRKAVIPFII